MLLVEFVSGLMQRSIAIDNLLAEATSSYACVIRLPHSGFKAGQTKQRAQPGTFPFNRVCVLS